MVASMLDLEYIGLISPWRAKRMLSGRNTPRGSCLANFKRLFFKQLGGFDSRCWGEKLVFVQGCTVSIGAYRRCTFKICYEMNKRRSEAVGVASGGGGVLMLQMWPTTCRVWVGWGHGNAAGGDVGHCWSRRHAMGMLLAWLDAIIS